MVVYAWPCKKSLAGGQECKRLRWTLDGRGPISSAMVVEEQGY